MKRSARAVPLKPFMLALAKGAGQVLMKYYEKVHTIKVKPDAGIVTEADQHAEDYILKHIFKKFPQSSIITEESGEFYNASPWKWIIDPLDGTTNYAHGFPWFCVSIAAYFEEVPKAGVIFNPVNREMFYAEKGKGAFLGTKRLKCSREGQIEKALVATGFSYVKGAISKQVETFERMNRVAQGVRRPGSAALDLAYVACGRYEGFWENHLSAWDIAAGMVLVEEAGGKVTDFQSRYPDIMKGEILAANNALHPKMLAILHGR